jgi:uncharacterized membrane protein
MSSTGAVDEVRADPSPARAPHLVERVLAIQLSTWFLLIGTFVGLFMVFFIPPGQGLDEPNHFSRVWSITEGHIVSDEKLPGQIVWIYPSPGISASQAVKPGIHRFGDPIPACVQRYLATLYADGATPGGFTPGDFWHTPTGCSNQPARFVAFENSALEPPVAYAPEVVAVGVLRLVRAPVPVIFFGGRLFGLAGFLLIVWLALRVSPRGKPVLFVVGTMPIALQQAAAYSADSMTTALALLAVALALRCCLDPDATRRWFGYLAVTLVALALTKPTYVVLAGLVLLVPAAVAASSKGRALVAKAVVLLLAIAASAGWLIAIRHLSLAAYFPPNALQPHKQLSYVLHHPYGYLQTIGRTLQLGWDTHRWWSFVASVGFYPTGRAPWLNSWFVLLAVAGLLFAFVIEFGARARVVGFAGVVRALWPIVLLVVGVFAVLTSFWTGWTGVGAPLINGLQGRYLLPLISLPMMTIAFTTRLERPRRITWIVVAIALVLMVAEIVKIVTTFY